MEGLQPSWSTPQEGWKATARFIPINVYDEELPATVEDDGFQCPACRGRFAPHTRIRGECRHAPDEAEESDPEAEDVWFQDDDMIEYQPEELQEEPERAVHVEEEAVRELE